MKPIIIIPSRMGSTRLKNKPLIKIDGVPLVLRVWALAHSTGIRTVVACDDEQVLNLLMHSGVDAVMTDPALATGTDRVWAALQEIDPDGYYDTIINVQGDLPYFNPDIIHVSRFSLLEPEVDVGVLGSYMDIHGRDYHNPSVVKIRCKKTGRVRTFTRKNPLTLTALKHVGIYAYKRAALEKFVSAPQSKHELKESLEQLRGLDIGLVYQCSIVNSDWEEVNTQEDLDRITKKLQQKTAE